MERLSGALQENILTLLCYDEKAIPLIINSIKVELFESSIFREIASSAINYYLEFKKPVGDHIADTLEHFINDKRKGELYEDILIQLYDNKDSVNKEFVLKNLFRFVRLQNLKISILEAGKQVEKGDLEKAEEIYNKYKAQELVTFDSGTSIKDTEKFISFLDVKENTELVTGIKELDKYQICPAPKELFVVVGLSNKGKSWFLVHMGKYNLLQKKKVLHLTLEMSEEKVAMRYVQSLLAMGKRKEDSEIPYFSKDEKGYLNNIIYDTVKPDLTFEDKKIREKLLKKLEVFARKNLIIKSFPIGALTVPQLKTYLENLHIHHNFIPDIILLDYADLMQIDARNLRIDTGVLYKDLRGVACIYNTAMVTVSQANRSGEDVRILTRKHLAEDFSKIMVSDNLITYNQTKEERKLGLARLFVDKSRNDRVGDLIMISQSYKTGQFCIDSALACNEYNAKKGVIIPFEEDEEKYDIKKRRRKFFKSKD